VSWLKRWYLDDGTFLCTAAEGEAILRYLKPALQAVGLNLNHKKTTVWGPSLPRPEASAQLLGDSPLKTVTIIPFVE
jgi:hypothetical protein